MSKTVLGGGIGGLSAAYYLRKAFPNNKIRLLEAKSRTGGWMKSITDEGYLFEQGPRTIRTRGYKGANTLDLIEELGLQSKVVPLTTDNAAVKNRMIYFNGELHSLPSSFKALFKKHTPFSKPLIYYLLQEIVTPRKTITDNDESIYSFARRRFGKEVADYAISPLVCGICAGNAHEISVNLIMEDLFKYEQLYGSIGAGLIYNAFKSSFKYKPTSQLYKQAKKEQWNIYVLENGLETLPKQLAEVNTSNGIEISLNSTCTSIDFDDKVTLGINNNVIIRTDHLIVCTPSYILQNLLKGHPKLSLLLQKIPYVTVGVVNLQYNCNVLEHEGFGFLVPPSEKLPILGVTFDSCCTPYDDGTVLTVMMGGYWFKQHFGDNPTKEELLDVAITQVSETMGITQKPDKSLVNILKNCIPQYVVGHKGLLKEIDTYIKNYNLPLSLCGASYHGIGINDVIWSSRIAVENINNLE